MYSERNILIAFLLNLLFSVFEFFGGIFTGSAAILSDAIHDMADALSIGISYILERRSKKTPDQNFTFGYSRYSVMGGLITTIFLLVGSFFAIYNAIKRLIHPIEIDSNGMIIIAIVGFCVNLAAALCTREGENLNQKAVNLHMLEDVTGWIIVLIGAVIMRFSNLYVIDPIISIAVSVFIAIKAIRNFSEIIGIFLMKAPKCCPVSAIKNDIQDVPGVEDVHHMHIWSMDGLQHCASMHVVTDSDGSAIKREIQACLRKYRIMHVTIEIENSNEVCHAAQCNMELITHNHADHNHH